MMVLYGTVQKLQDKIEALEPSTRTKYQNQLPEQVQEPGQVQEP